MKYKPLVAVLIFTLGFGAALFAPPQEVSAASGNCYFNSTGGPVTGTGRCSVPGRYGAYGVNDVLSGRSSTGAGKAIPNGVNTKNEFINFIRNRFSNGGTQDRVGAAFIIQELRSNNDYIWPSNADVNDWENLMRLSSVTVSRGVDNTVGRTSYYDPGKHNTFYAAHPTVSREVIFIRQNGRLLAEIETACGNMVAGPVSIIDWTLAGTSTANKATVRPGGTIRWNHVVQNTGPDDMNERLESYTEWVATTGPGAANGARIKTCNNRDGLESAPGAASREVCNTVNAFNVPLSAADGQEYCQRIQYRPTRPGRNPFDNSARACVRVVETPGTLECGSFSSVPSNPRPGNNVDVTFGILGTPTPAYTLSYTQTDPTGTVTTVNRPGVSSVTLTIASALAGTYRFDWTFQNGDGTTLTCDGGVDIAAKPTFEVWNGDANAAAGLIDASCNPSNTTISAFNEAGVGSKTQAAAFAASMIEGFTSADSRGSGIELTFANTNGGFGGEFNQTYCIPDFWTDQPLVAGPQSYGNETGVTNSVARYVDGDIYINGNIEYTVGGFGLASVPFRGFFATGNIYIFGNDAVGVTRLDGIYAAKGKIYTCSVDNGLGGLRAASLIDMEIARGNCGRQLIVNGAFIAGGGIKLQRTFTDALNAPAELFVFSPEVWLQAIQPQIPLLPNSGIDGFDSITGLPPVL